METEEGTVNDWIGFVAILGQIVVEFNHRLANGQQMARPGTWKSRSALLASIA
ncbi:MAG TPA: hypothetical protein VMX16_19775 [Terriglobia bacterium]|nr:hypothetical protein [Terriglobia bacterium]